MKMRNVLAVMALSIWISRSVRAVEFSDWCAPVNLGPPINLSPSSDGGPAISKNGLSLYFHSNRTGNFDLYVSQRESKDSPWGEPHNLGPTINTASVETVPALSRDGHWLFFNAFNRLGGFGGFDIWASYRHNVHDDFAWQTPVNLGPGVNSPFNDVGPGYFENDEGGAALLFFGSNRPDPQGRGGRMDIYVSAQQADGSFGPAQLVEELSSAANDVRPSIRFDGLEMFFTRDQSAALLNDNDIWVSTRKSVSDSWTTPQPLGPVVNSDVDDIRAYISADRETLYFESGPLEPNGDMDIYVTTRSKKGNCD